MLQTLSPRALLRSPDYFPLRADLERGTMKFVPMSASSYRDSVFLDTRTRPVAGEAFEVRLDDLGLEAAGAPLKARIHFIFNTSFCCSTLLARHFEAQPECFVLKEPVLLAQLAVAPERGSEIWKKALDISLALFARTYAARQMVVIKPNEWCNSLAPELLSREGMTATLLGTPARDFILAVLKNEERRAWLRTRLPSALEDGKQFLRLRPIALRPPETSDAIAACYIWLLNQCRFQRLAAGPVTGRKIAALNGNELADTPKLVLPIHFALCGIAGTIRPSAMEAYSKGTRFAYTGADRSSDLAEQDNRCGDEVAEALRWAESHDFGDLLAYR